MGELAALLDPGPDHGGGRLNGEVADNLDDAWKAAVRADLPSGSRCGPFGARRARRRLHLAVRRSWGRASESVLTIAKSHVGDFAQGQSGPAYTIVVTNSVSATGGGYTGPATAPPSIVNLASVSGGGATASANTSDPTSIDTSTTGIPALGTAGLVLLGLLLAAAGWVASRRTGA